MLIVQFSTIFAIFVYTTLHAMAMKKILPVILMFILAFQINGYSQLFKGGFMIGVNGCQEDGIANSGYSQPGLMLGSFVYTSLSPTIDLQLEMKYMGEGMRLMNTDGSLAYENQLNYIQIPLIFRYNVIPTVGLEAGLGVGYLFYSSGDVGINYSDVGTNFNTFDFHGLLSVTYKLNSHFNVDLRLTYSLKSIITLTGDTYSPNYYLPAGVYNDVLTIGLYYVLGNR